MGVGGQVAAFFGFVYDGAGRLVGGLERNCGGEGEVEVCWLAPEYFKKEFGRSCSRGRHAVGECCEGRYEVAVNC